MPCKVSEKNLESKLPPPDDFAQFMTWAGLEDALQGIRNDLESKLPSPDEGVELVIHFILKQPNQNVCLHFKRNGKLYFYMK
jgi:hypothetical protein